ncbi:MFS transporter [Streptomyces scopuliridis]|uniref:MFS transporter n=1 Tax=Streptomyces scopuliridis TaxID=452529 RepID=UPI00367A26A6
MVRRSLGRQFGWLWAAYGVSALGTWLAFDAFPLIAILVLHAGTTEVSLPAAAGLAVGAVVAVPLGPWVEFRRKRPVMIAMDLIRFAALMSVPAAFVLGLLSFVQLLVVAVVIGAADIAFTAAGGACLKALVRPEDLLVANGRFESTAWTASVLGPPLGGAAIGLFGPVMTVVANAVSYLLSAAGIRAIGGEEPRPARTGAPRFRVGDLLDGWRYILAHPALRPLFFNTVLVSGLIMATSPVLAVLMLSHLGFAPWQYGLAFIGPGVGGMVLVMAVEFGLITCMGVFNPVYATYRLHHTATDRVARTLSAWSVTSKVTIAALTALWGLLAGLTGPRTAIAIAGLLLLTTPLLLPRHDNTPDHEPERAQRHI